MTHLLVALLVLGTALAPAAAQSPPPSAVATPAATPIPLAEVVGAAEAVTLELRELDQRLADDTVTSRVARDLERIVERIDGREQELADLLNRGRTLTTADRAAEPWLALRGELVGDRNQLLGRATALDGEITALDGTLVVWRRTADAVREAAAPAPVVAKVATVLRLLQESRARASAARGRILVLQDAIGAQVARCDAALQRLQEARRTALRQLFERDRPTIWSELATHDLVAEAVAARSTLMAKELPLAKGYLHARAGRLAWQLVLAIALTVLFLRLRARTRVDADVDPALARRARAFAAPVACAVVTTLLLTDWFAPVEPRPIRMAMLLIALVAVIRVLLLVVEPWLRPIVRAIPVFFAIDQVRGGFGGAAVIEHLLLLFEVGVLVAALVYLPRAMTREAERLEDEPPPPWLPRIRRTMHRAAVGVGAAALAGAFGWTHVTRLVGLLVGGGTGFAFLLYSVVQVLGGTIAYLLRIRPLSRLHVVQRYRGAIQVRADHALVWLAIALWALTLLDAIGLWAPLRDGARRLLATRIGVGEIGLSPGNVVVFVATLFVGWWASRIVTALLEEDVLPHVELPRGVPASLSRFAHYVILVATVMIGFGAIGVDLGKFGLLAGALGVGVGFGLQNVVNNFVSGLILLFERPVQIGDAVQIGSIVGEVRRIGVRSSTIRTWQGAEVIVPNATLISDPVTNWTLSDQMRRLDVPIAVAPRSNPLHVAEVLRDAAASVAGVVKDPAPQVVFQGFGPWSVDFELRAWTRRYEDGVPVRSELLLTVWGALAAAGIELPPPPAPVAPPGPPRPR